jgi:large subunit ribosomal protein L4
MANTVQVDLPAEIFDVQTNVPLLHQVVVAQLAAARQGTHKTKTRAEVSGAGRKPFKQKGTGRARQGSIRAPHMTGGGVVHGPTPRDYSQRTPKKMIAAALSVRNIEEVHVLYVDQLNTYDVLVSDDVVFTKAAYEAFVADKAAKNEEDAK